MRLQIKRKVKKSTKKVKKETYKKDLEVVLNKNYKDESDYTQDDVVMELSKLRYGIINCCDIDKVVMADGNIEITQGWVEFILIMLDALIERHPKDFGKLLQKYQVTNQLFCVDTLYGKYSFDAEYQYKAFKIYNSGYYLEAVLNSETIFNAVIGLANALDYQLGDIKVHLINKKYPTVKLNFDTLVDKEEIVDIYSIDSYLKDGIHLVSVDLDGEEVKLHRIDVALAVYCNWLSRNYSKDELLAIDKVGNTYITINNNEVSNAYALENKELAITTDCNTEDIVEFIKKSIEQLELRKDILRFKFRLLKKKDELKEWEID